MKRIKLTVAYDGTHYSGWQIQPTSPTIEKALDEAIEQVTGEKLHVTGASRTDAGVHAMGNVAVFDTQASIPAERWCYALNRYLPEDISVQKSEEVDKDFHPRHCDTEKTYEYQIYNAEFPNPKIRSYAWHIAGKLNLEHMRNAAKILVGEHDFKSFCCVRTQAENTVRKVYSIEITQKPDNIIVISVRGNGFLYNMVRIIAGTLVQVGKGARSIEDVEHMLAAKDRSCAGQTAPPQGLTLVRIDYL
ncbi:MAG: tRNA pseudouridine(38-40) synthase TruA [Eubacteriales bacterium]|nr:tRNA pseudouridine(38-40) synthase TruA [Eubacteriales bacterium]